MNRREFIGAVAVALSGAASAAEVAPSRTLTLKKASAGADVRLSNTAKYYDGPTVASGSVFDPRMVCGGSVDCRELTQASVATVKDVLCQAARRVLPKGTRFYVLDGGHHRVNGERGPEEVDVFAWLYSPTKLQPPRSYQVIAEVTA